MRVSGDKTYISILDQFLFAGRLQSALQKKNKKRRLLKWACQSLETYSLAMDQIFTKYGGHLLKESEPVWQDSSLLENGSGSDSSIFWFLRRSRSRFIKLFGKTAPLYSGPTCRRGGAGESREKPHFCGSSP